MNASTDPKSDKPRRRIVRRLLIGGGVFVGLIVLAVVLALVLVPAEKIQEIAFEQLESNTGLRGSATGASVSIFPLGAKLEGLKIDDPSDASPVWEELEIELDSAVVTANLMSILKGAPQISEVRLVRPRVDVVLAEPAATEATEGGASSSSEGSPEVAAALGLLSIEDGAVKITQPTGQVIELTGLNNAASLKLAAGVATGTVSGSLDRVALSGGEMPKPIELPRVEWELDLNAQVDGTGGRVAVKRVEMAGMQATGDASWKGTAPELDVTLKVDGDIPQVWAELGRGFVDPSTLPPGFTLDDFDLVGGTVAADVTYKGVVPEADPDDPTAALKPLRVRGRLDGLRPSVFGRDDLLAVEGEFEMNPELIFARNLKISGDVLSGEGGIQVPTALDGPLTGGLGLELQTARARELAASLWPRLEKLATPEGGEAPVGPDEWPEVDGLVKANLTFDVPVDGSFDPVAGRADAITWTASTAPRLTLKLPTFTEAFEASGVGMEGDLKSAKLTRGQVRGPGVDATAALELGGWPEVIRVRGTADATAIDLDALQAAMVKPETAWIPSHWIDDALGVRVAHAQDTQDEIAPPPANLDVDVQLRANEILSAGYTLRDAQARLMLLEQKLDVQDVQAQLGTGTVTGRAGVDWTQDQPTWMSDLDANAIPASTLLEPFAGPLAQAISTQFSGAIDLDGPLATAPEQVIAAITGLADLRAEDGTVAAEDLLGPTVSQFLGKNASEWKKLSFDALDANLEVREGKVWFEKLLIRGTTEVDAGGWVGLDGQTNVRLDVRLPAGVTPELGSLQPVADFLKDDAGRIAFGVNVTGPGAKPKVQIDLADLQQRATDRAQDAAKDEAQNALDDLIDRNRGGIEDALGDILGGNAAGDSNATEKSLEEKAKEGVGGLLDRLKGGKKKGGGR